MENLGIIPLAGSVAAALELRSKLPSPHCDPVQQQIMGKFGMASPRREKSPLVSQKMQQDLSEIARDRCASISHPLPEKDFSLTAGKIKGLKPWLWGDEWCNINIM